LLQRCLHDLLSIRFQGGSQSRCRTAGEPGNVVSHRTAGTIRRQIAVAGLFHHFDILAGDLADRRSNIARPPRLGTGDDEGLVLA
jgi:hypothetical protein